MVAVTSLTGPRRTGGHLSPVLALGDIAGDAVRRHLAGLQLRGYTPGTIYCRRRLLARLAAALPVPLLDATAAHLATWRAALTVGPGAVAGYVSHAREFYRWAVAEQLIDASPAERLPVPRLPRRHPRPIADADLFAAIAAAPDRIRPWLVLAGWCGLRAKEIALLRRECVLERARPDPLLLVACDATKGRADRIIPLHQFALAELLAAGLPRAGWVFPRHDGQPGPNRPWLVSHLCNAWLHDSGHPETLHQLRHRFATVTYQDSRDLRMVQELLGHAHPQTTALYADWDQAEAAIVIARIPAPGPARRAQLAAGMPR